MKKRLLIFCFLLPLSLFAQKPQWQWAGIGNDGDYGWATDVVVDVFGNVYVTGSFTNTLILGSFTLTSVGNSDIFWAKYDAVGQVLWAKCAGGTGDDKGGGIALDDVGNIYVSSTFYDSALYNGVYQNVNGESDICLAKYNGQGDQIWLKTWGSIYNDISGRLSIMDNEIVFVGLFNHYGGSPAVYETIDFDSYVLTSYGNGDVFIVKADTNGTIIWAKNAGGKFADYAGGVAVDNKKNIFIDGSTGSSKMIFDSDTLFNKNMFVAKYDSIGNVSWVKGIHCDHPFNGISIAADNLGNAYIVGGSYLGDVFNFGTTLLSQDHSFLAKYDSLGTLTWAKNIGYNSYSTAYDLELDAVNNIFVTGTFEGTGTFGLDTFVSNGYQDIYVNKYDSNGNHIWAVQAGGGSNDGGYGICLDNDGNILVTGYVSSAPAYFGSHTVSAVGFWDMFVAKLSTTTGLPVLTKDDEIIRVYPNPASGVFTVHFEIGFSELRMYDIQGRVVEKVCILPGQKEIELDGSYFSNGIYYLQLIGKSMPEVKKIIVQH